MRNVQQEVPKGHERRAIGIRPLSGSLDTRRTGRPQGPAVHMRPGIPPRCAGMRDRRRAGGQARTCRGPVWFLLALVLALRAIDNGGRWRPRQTRPNHHPRSRCSATKCDMERRTSEAETAAAGSESACETRVLWAQSYPPAGPSLTECDASCSRLSGSTGRRGGHRPRLLTASRCLRGSLGEGL